MKTNSDYQKEIEESEERFRSIIEENVNAMILANQKGQITMVNKVACQLFGYTKEEFLCIGIDKLVPDSVEKHEKKRKKIHQEPTARSMGSEKELSAKRKDGSTFDVEIELNPIHVNKEQFVLATIQDITERKRAEQQAKGIQSVINEGWAFIEFYPDGTVLNANSIFIELFGYKNLKEIQGQHHSIFCDKEHVNSPDYLRFWKELKKGKTQSGEFERKAKSGEQIWINASYSPVTDGKGKVIKIMKIAADVCDRKKAEQQAKGIQSVINEGWAFIEFYPDGTVLDANSNFIKLFGYRNLKEIQGQHHSIFCDKKHINSPDYLRFWKELKEGKTQSGEFERKAKNGEQIWINASYSPVKDGKGKVIKIMKIAADITASKKLETEMKAVKARELREAQNQLIQSEKMASLGNLMAGIAHEINTPLGAIKASIEGILENDSSYKDFFDLFHLLSKEEIAVFLDMVQYSVSHNPILSSREERQAKRSLRNRLESLEIINAYDIADMMTDLHLLDVTDQYFSLINKKENLTIFKTALNITVQHRNGGTIKIAVDKASKIIFALKSYAHFDQEDNFEEVNISEGIENIITLYSNSLKQGMELNKKYDQTPLVKCLPDQLGQVWTNLISNAIHAMNGEGTLSIAVEDHPKSVCVKIGDSGKGIPEDVANHIFTPFFTTKSSGEGSGLGLDLVKKIVDKHGGNISFKSEPGSTVFTVEIPKKEYIDKLSTAKFEELKAIEQEKENEIKRKISDV